MAAIAVATWSGASAQDDKPVPDLLVRAKEKGALPVCADPYAYPFATQAGDPPGFDIEIIRAIAADAGLGVDYVWADTGSRGGLGKALRGSIMKGHCAVFLGLAVDDESIKEMDEKDLAFTRPYLGLGYILVVQGPAESATGLTDLKEMKVGVSMSTPMDGYLFEIGQPRELYLGNRRVMQGMAKGEINAAMVFSPSLAEARREFPDAKFHVVANYQPESNLRWNLAMVVPKDQPAVTALLEQGIEKLLKSGKIKEIVESYGMPFYPPFE